MTKKFLAIFWKRKNKKTPEKRAPKSFFKIFTAVEIIVIHTFFGGKLRAHTVSFFNGHVFCTRLYVILQKMFAVFTALFFFALH